MRSNSTHYWVLSLALASGCGGSSGPGQAGTDADSTATDAVAADATTSGATDATATTVSSDAASETTVADADTFGPYPAGPYGNAVGDVLQNLNWEGYENDTATGLSTSSPYVKTSLDQLRRKATKGYGIVHISEFI